MEVGLERAVAYLRRLDSGDQGSSPLPARDGSAIELRDDLLGNGEGRARASAAGDKHEAQGIRGPVDQHQPVRRRSEGPSPAFHHGRCWTPEDSGIFIENEVVDSGGSKGGRRRRIVMGVADDLRPIGRCARQ